MASTNAARKAAQMAPPTGAPPSPTRAARPGPPPRQTPARPTTPPGRPRPPPPPAPRRGRRCRPPLCPRSRRTGAAPVLSHASAAGAPTAPPLPPLLPYASPPRHPDILHPCYRNCAPASYSPLGDPYNPVSSGHKRTGGGPVDARFDLIGIVTRDRRASLALCRKLGLDVPGRAGGGRRGRGGG